MKLRLASIAALGLLWAAPAFGQGCAMCYTSAKGAPKDGQRAIDRGVTILLVPPVGVMTLGMGAMMFYGKKRDQDK